MLDARAFAENSIFAFEEVIHLYKYMRIYLWRALRTRDLRMKVLRMMDLIADSRFGEKNRQMSTYSNLFS